jgi:hypothetical protein
MQSAARTRCEAPRGVAASGAVQDGSCCVARVNSPDVGYIKV